MTEYVQEMLKEAREELVQADSKAALILASSGVALDALTGGGFSPEETVAAYREYTRLLLGQPLLEVAEGSGRSGSRRARLLLESMAPADRPRCPCSRRVCAGAGRRRSSRTP